MNTLEAFLSGRLRPFLPALLLLSLFSSPAWGAEPTLSFDVAAGEATTTLKAFAQQANREIMFPVEGVETVRTNPVRGEYSVKEALGLLLAGTPLRAIEDKETGAVVVRHVDVPNGARAVAATRQRPERTLRASAVGVDVGSVRGSLGWEDGRPAAGVMVVATESGQAVSTDRYGEYFFPALPSGIYLLVAEADGYRPLHFTDVIVRPATDIVLTAQFLRKAIVGSDLTPFLVRDQAASVLDPYEVVGDRMRPFQSANVDLPRTMNDAQSYHIFERRAIEQSGATSVEEFLRLRLPMDATEVPNNFQENNSNISSFNLRGLGANHTLVLIDGRRPADYNNVFATGNQADINGIPLAAIDRIEVLPASASGIYGANAVGGVINVVLRRNYVGAQVSVSYNNTFSGDAPVRSVNFAAGTSFENGKTQVMVSGSSSETDMLRGKDRNYVQRGRELIRQNDPDFFLPPNAQPLGATPNIRSNNNTPLFGPGTPTFTTVPVGFGGGDRASTLAALQSNAGTYNYDPAPTYQRGGARSLIGTPSSVTANQVKISRQFRPWLEAFVEYRRSTNQSINSEFNPFSPTANFLIPATAPTNPFGQAVRLAIPSDPTGAVGEFKLRLVSLRALTGVIVDLPHDWRVQADFTWNRALTTQSQLALNTAAMNTHFNNGVLNPFRDTVAFPLDLTPYQGQIDVNSRNTLEEYAFRAAGPVWSLPAGPVKLAVTFNFREEDIPTFRSDTIYNTPPNSFWTVPARSSGVEATYAELMVPVVGASKTWPLLRQLDFQVAVREERFKINTATALVTSSTASVNFNEASYSALTPTYGMRFRPWDSLLLRASYSEAFLPPTYNQLAANPLVRSTRVFDPKRGNASTTVDFISGANPDAIPEWAENTNLGLVWEPKKISGLRLSVDYSRIKKTDRITTLSAQGTVDFEDFLPDRVARGPAVAGDPFSVGPILLVNARSFNATLAVTESYDASINYSRRTARWGVWNIWSTASWWMHYQLQATVNAPLVEFIGSPGYVKFKAAGGLTCDYNHWTFGWSSRFVDGYLQRPAVAAAQKADSIPSQHYHDVFVARRFPQVTAAEASWIRRAFERTEIQVGVQNVLNKPPPFDAFRTPHYLSTHGNARLATYTLTLRKNF